MEEESRQRVAAIVLRSIAVGMGIAGVALLVLGAADSKDVAILQALGLSSLAVGSFVAR